ncbi:MAG: alpha-E domain-containing protein [Caulobacterales bacterium]|nr:alpha-E domain-containing protein [Caulobacterales bacterium]
MTEATDPAKPWWLNTPYPPLYIPFKLLSEHLAARLIDSRLSPNAITVTWTLLLIAASVALAFEQAGIAFLAVLLSVLLDCLDGDLARGRNQASLSGTFLEQLAHWIGNMALMAGAGASLLLADPRPQNVLLVSALAVVQAVYIAVIRQVRSARRTAASMRERLSGDFWKLLLELESRLAAGPGGKFSEAAGLARAEEALLSLATLSGLTQENMNRVAGWRFLDMGRRVERGVTTCRMMRQLAMDDATVDDLDLLLDLVDSQITYRSRYVVGIAMTPVRDLVMLDPFNPRSVAFQVAALTGHIDGLPTLLNDGMPEEPKRILARVNGVIDAEDAGALDMAKIQALEQMLMSLSNAISDRYFQQGANAAPTKKLGGLG